MIYLFFFALFRFSKISLPELLSLNHRDFVGIVFVGITKVRLYVNDGVGMYSIAISVTPFNYQLGNFGISFLM